MERERRKKTKKSKEEGGETSTRGKENQDLGFFFLFDLSSFSLPLCSFCVMLIAFDSFRLFSPLCLPWLNLYIVLPWSLTKIFCGFQHRLPRTISGGDKRKSLLGTMDPRTCLALWAWCCCQLVHLNAAFVWI